MRRTSQQKQAAAAAAAGVIGLGSLGKKPKRVALCGNPNVGKTSLFNALTGLRQRVGNYPGITVEKVEGTIRSPAGPIEVVDLPGCYSLAPRSPDEVVARDEIAGRMSGRPAPDVVVVVADATNLERSLLLVTQTIDSGVNVIVSLNQWDMALASGLQIDIEALATALGVPVIPTCGRTGQGCDELVQAMIAGGARGHPLVLDCPEIVNDKARALAPLIADREIGPGNGQRRATMLLTSAVLAKEALEALDAEGTPEARTLAAELRLGRDDLEAAGVDTATCSTEARYAAIEKIVGPVITRPMELALWQGRVDRFLTHPITGSVALVAIFLLIFMVVYSWSGPAIDFVDENLASFGEWLGTAVGGGLLGSFVQDGIVAGFGAFLVFVPQIAMLFLLLEALEAPGYLARAAFLDRLMGKFGLPGRSFLPLLSGFACAIPAIMATRTIENRRDRMITMAIAPLMSCQARLPVYAVIVGALFAASPAWVPSVVVISMYLVGIVVAGMVAILLRHTVLPGSRSALLLELPPYRRPSFRSVVYNTGRRTWSFIVGAGPVILVLMMVLWAALTFPQDVELSRDFEAETAVLEQRLDAVAVDSTEAGALREQLKELGSQESSDRLRGSYMGQAGQIIEPVIEPLGFDWKVGVAIIGSFAAREVFVPTLGVIYSVGDEADEKDAGLLASIRADRWPDGRPVFTPLMGIALLVFYVIALQCVSTLGVLKRETNSWRWPVGLFVAYTLLAYVASLAVFQLGGLLGFA